MPNTWCLNNQIHQIWFIISLIYYKFQYEKKLLVARYSAFNLIGCAPDTQLETLIAFEFLTCNIESEVMVRFTTN